MDRSGGRPETQPDGDDPGARARRSERVARVVLVTTGGGTVDITQTAVDLLERACSIAAPPRCDGADMRPPPCTPTWAALCQHLGRCRFSPTCPLAGTKASDPAIAPARTQQHACVVVTLASTRVDAHRELHRHLTREANVQCHLVRSEAANWSACRSAVPASEVLVIDRSWCDQHSLRAIASVVDREPKLRVMVHDDAVVNQALADMVVRHRFHGLLHAHCPPEIGVKAIRAVMRGELWLPRALLRAHLPAGNAPVAGDSTASLYATLPEGLTDRQNEIVAHLRQGFTNKEIAGRLGIKEDTVKKHLQAVFSKLGVHRRALVALRGRESRISAAR